MNVDDMASTATYTLIWTGRSATRKTLFDMICSTLDHHALHGRIASAVQGYVDDEGSSAGVPGRCASFDQYDTAGEHIDVVGARWSTSDALRQAIHNSYLTMTPETHHN